MQKILIVEDNPDNLDMLTKRLKRRGFEIVQAIDGRQGCEKARSEFPDLILMDMHLPVMDGCEATQTIKADPQTGNIPILALTADAMAGDREIALAAGCDDYETKPVDLPRLLEKIQQLLMRGNRQ